MKQATVHMRFRDDLEMHQKLVEAAKKNGRTLNGEICARLQASFESQRTAEIVEMALNAWQAKRMPLSSFGGVTGPLAAGSLYKSYWQGG